MNYESANGCFPGNSYSALTAAQGSTFPNFSAFVRMTLYYEQQGVYNATNFMQTAFDPANITIAGVAINTMMCPSDPWTPQIISATTPNSSFKSVYNLNALPPGT